MEAPWGGIADRQCAAVTAAQERCACSALLDTSPYRTLSESIPCSGNGNGGSMNVMAYTTPWWPLPLTAWRSTQPVWLSHAVQGMEKLSAGGGPGVRYPINVQIARLGHIPGVR